MNKTPTTRRFRFSLRTLFWLTLVVPLVIFAAHEHHQHVRLDARVKALEQSMIHRQVSHARAIGNYKQLVDNQQNLIARYKRLVLRPRVGG